MGKYKPEKQPPSHKADRDRDHAKQQKQDPKLMTRAGRNRTKNISNAKGTATPKGKQHGRR